MFDRINEMQQKMEASKAKLDEIMVHGESPDGQVKVTVTANKKVQNIEIAPALVQEADKDKLEDMILSAMTRAMDKADVTAAAEMQKMAGDILPGGLGALGNLFGG